MGRGGLPFFEKGNRCPLILDRRIRQLFDPTVQIKIRRFRLLLFDPTVQNQRAVAAFFKKGC